MLDAALRADGRSLGEHLGAVRDRVPMRRIVGIQRDPAALVEAVATYLDEGYVRIKIKIKPGRDIAETAAVREAFGGIPLQVDANSAYTLDDIETLAELDRFDLLLIEQPLQEDDLVDHATLARHLRTPVCLDESIVSLKAAADALALGRHPSSTSRRAGSAATSRRVAIHDLCRDAGIPVWCGGMLETGIGRAANAALAALPGFTLPGDVSASSRFYAPRHRDRACRPRRRPRARAHRSRGRRRDRPCRARRLHRGARDHPAVTVAGPVVFRRRRTFAAAVALCTIAALSACAVDMGDKAPPPLPDDVTAVLVQLRSDVAARQAQVEVHNGTDQPLHIADVTVSDPRLAESASRVLDRESTVPPGGTVDIRIQLPAMACDVTTGSLTVQLTFVGRGAPEVRQGPLPDKLDVLSPIHEQECRAQALGRAAALSIASFAPSPAGRSGRSDARDRADGRGRRSDRRHPVHEPAVFRATTWAVISRSTSRSRKTTRPRPSMLPLVPFRCDPHAVQEDKRGTVFDLDVEVAGDPGVVQLAASEDMRGDILTWVAEWCGFGPGSTGP